jgi:predicted DNA-binding transcriptional regulator AlpA
MNRMDAMDKLLTVAEVAAMIRVPQGTLRYWRHLGSGPRSFKMGPRRVVYREQDVLEWVAAQYAEQRDNSGRADAVPVPGLATRRDHGQRGRAEG